MALSYFSPRGLSEAQANNIGTTAGGSIKTSVVSGTNLFIAGDFTTYIDKNGKVTTCNGLAKIDLTTGLHDASFSTGTGFNSFVNDIKLYDGGTTLLVGGNFTSYNGTTRQYICKVSASTGALNTTFNTASGCNAYVHQITYTQWDGAENNTPWIVGNFTTYKGTTRQRVARIDGATGALNTAFDSASGANSTCYGASSYFFDGTNYWMYITGEFTTYKATTRQYIAKVNAVTGALNTTFNSASGFNAYAYDMVYTYSGTDAVALWVSGNYTTYKGTSRNRIAKLNASTAALDTTFAPGTGFDSSTHQIRSDGTYIYASGPFTDYAGSARGGLAKLDVTTAALDSTFNPPSSGFAGVFQTALALDSTNNALYVGSANTFYGGKFYNGLTKVSTVNAQSIDQAQQYGFVLTGVQYGTVYVIVSGIYAYIGGSFTGYVSPTNKYTAAAGLIKINVLSREVDTTFNAGTGAEVYCMLLSGNDLYIGGPFTSYNGTTRQYVAKVNATTGALDTTFDSASGTNGIVYSLALNGNDLYIGGDFTSYKATTRERVVKVNATTAALDTTFDSASGFNAVVYAVVFNGTDLYIGGAFTAYKGTTRQYIAKVNGSTAALDTTFDSASGFNNIVDPNTMVYDSGNLYVGGEFTTYKGTTRQYIAKLNSSTAALDTTFDSASGFNAVVRNICLDSGSLYVVGGFTTYKGTTRQRVAKISATTAALDTTFNSASGADAILLGCTITSGVLYMCGLQTVYGTNSRKYFTAVDATTAIDGGVF